ELEQRARELLHERGVKLQDIAELVYYLQAKYFNDLTLDMCLYNVNRVLSKRDVQHAVLTGIELDVLAEKNQLSEPLLDIIKRDEGLHGNHDVIAYTIVNVYASLGIPSHGQL